MSKRNLPVFVAALLGAAIGVLVGVGLTRWLWPTTPVSNPPLPSPTLQPTPAPQATWTPAAEETAVGSEWEQLAVVVSALYAQDGDLDRARQRLEAAGAADPASQIGDLALRYAAEGKALLATDLATLAAALGAEESELLALAATPTPASSPVTSPSPAPSLTPTASPTTTPTFTPEPTATATKAPTATRPRATRPPPSATPLPPPVVTPRPLVWDHRVDSLDPAVKLLEAEVAPGQVYWRLVRQEWRRAAEGGNMLLYINVLDEFGQPVWGQEVIVENGGHAVLYTDPKPGEVYGLNFVMSGTLGSYQAFVGGPVPSDRVVNLGLGERFGWTEHSTFVLEFQRTTR